MFPDEIIESILKHEGDEPYNPEKRREYYLKTRQLKGRTSVSKTISDRSSSVTRGSSKLPPKKPSPRKSGTAELEQQVEAMRSRLAELRKILADLVQKAKDRSGVEDPGEDPPKTSKQTGGSKPAKSEKTEQEKTAAAETAKDYYEKNKDKILSDQVKDLGEKLTVIAEKIQEMREKLADPVVKRIQTTNRSVGVDPNTTRKENGQNGRSS